MDRCAERDHEVGDLAEAAVLLGALQRHGDRGGGGLRADGGHVGRNHVLDEAERVLLRGRARDDVLEQDDAQVHDDDQHKDLGKHAHDLGDGAGVGHVGEDAVDVEGQEGNEDLGHDALNDLLELVEDLAQRLGAGGGDADAHDEGRDQRGHDAHERGHFHGEEAGEHGVLRVLGVVHHDGADLEEGREHGAVDNVGEAAGDDGGEIRNARGDREGLAGALTEIGDAGGDEADDDQRNAEAEEVAEDAVEGGADLNDDRQVRFLGDDTDDDTDCNGGDQLRQQAKVHFFLGFSHDVCSFLSCQKVSPFLIFLCGWVYSTTAMTSISHRSCLGSSRTATQERAGFETKYFSYTALNAPKSFMSARKQVVLMTLE